MTEKKIKNVGELKRALEFVDEDIPINLKVNYNNCWYIQEMGSIYVSHNEYSDTDEWCDLIGIKRCDEGMTENKRYKVKGTDEFFLHIEDTTFTEDKHEGSIYDIYQVACRLNEQDERIKELEQFKLSIISFAECNENINRQTLNELIELIDYD